MDDEQLAARRAEIPVHCAACGGEFPGTTELHNGICDECQKLTHGPNYRLIAKLQDQEREIARLTTANAEDRVARKAEVERLRDLVSTLHLYIGRHTQLTIPQKELLYDVVEAHYRVEGITDEPIERWWR